MPHPKRRPSGWRWVLLASLGVTAIVYPNFTPRDPGQLSIKVIDTESGEIVAAILVTREVEPWLGTKASARAMIYQGVAALRKEAARYPPPEWSSR